MEFNQYLRIVFKRWWLLLLLVMVGVSSAVYYTSRQPAVYSSTVTLLLSPAAGQDSLLPQYLSDRTGQLAQTYIRYLRTSTFAELVIKREELNISAGELVASVSARVVEGTQFFEITASGSTAERAQLLATVIANNFIDENLAQQAQQLAARQSASESGAMQSLLREKLERERQYYEQQVAGLRQQVEQIRSQPPSTARDETLGLVQEQLSSYEDRLLAIMSDQISLQPVAQSNLINTVTVIEPAPLPTSPVSTRQTQDILFAFLASLLVGVILAFALEYLDYTVKGPDDLEVVFGQPALGVLSDAVGDNSQPDELVVLSKPQSSTSEAFRALRTNIRFSRVGQELRSLVVTSAGPGEGKTTVAANLAVVLAQSGQRVLLIDADMRRPTVHKRFQLVNNLGLSSLMLAEDPTNPLVLERYLQPGPVENLRILTCGPIPPNPAELLSTEFARSLFTHLEQSVDIVIYDSPPALTVTDAVILSSRADAVLQVVRAGVTRRDVALRCREVLQRVGANALAPLLNRVKANDVGYYHYYYYSKYGYTDDEKRSGNGHGKPARVEKRRKEKSG
ncbi:MAG: polysaccharide biosynthesis tyrosine autokinase [Chloroflexi bacterium]|nr:MAG: polysaccharide biosynthesis tyrosine autokinase [Chloroflexota bacterium]